MRATLIIVALTALTAPDAHAQLGPNNFYVEVCYADEARIIGLTGAQDRTILWAYDRATRESKTLYATPHSFSFQAAPLFDNGVVFINEYRYNRISARILNHIIVDVREGGEPKLKILPTSDGEGVSAIGLHERSNSLVLHRYNPPSLLEEVIDEVIPADFSTESFELLNLETWEFEILDIPIKAQSYRSFVHEDSLYFIGFAPNNRTTKQTYIYDLEFKSPPTIFTPNITTLDAHISSGHLEILLDDFSVIRVEDGISVPVRSFPRATPFHRGHLYRDGYIAHEAGVHFFDGQAETTLSNIATDAHVNGDELFLTFPDTSFVEVHKNDAVTQLDIPHLHLDYIRTIPFNNVTQTGSGPVTLKIVIPLAILTTIAIALIRRRKRARRDEE